MMRSTHSTFVIHAWSPRSFQPFHVRWGFAACKQLALAGFLTSNVGEVTCTGCLEVLAADTVSRLKTAPKGEV